MPSTASPERAENGPTGLRALLSLCAGPLLLYALGYVALTWPAAWTFTTHWLCDDGDGMQNAWNLWWVGRACAHGTSPWATDMLFWPDGVTLIGQTLNPFNGFAAIVLEAFMAPVVAHNVLIVFAFAAGGWTCFLLARHVTGSYWGALFAGASFTFSHFHFAHAIGHMQLVSLEWMPLFALAFVRLLESGGFRRGVGAALALLLVVLCDWYYAFYCVLLGCMLVLGSVVRRRSVLFLFRPPWLAGMAAFVVLSLLTSGALGAALLWTNHRDPLLFAHETERSGMDALAPFVPSEIWRFSGWTSSVWRAWDDVPRSESSSYLGWTAMLCAAWALVAALRERRKGVWAWFWIGAVFLALALGPQLHAFGKYHPQVWLPYRALQAAFPPIELSGIPLRMSIAAHLAVAVLAAFGFVPFLRQAVRSRWLWLLVLAFFVFETVPGPLPVTRLELGEVPPVVRQLAELPLGAVHGLSSDEERKTVALYQQTLHQQPMTLGYVSREPRSLQPSKDLLRKLEAGREFAKLLREFRVRYLVRPADDSGPGLEPECARLWFDASHAIWVAAGDELAKDQAWRDALLGPRVACERKADGSALLRVESPLDAGRRFVLHVAAHPQPVRFWKWWVLGIARDGALAQELLGEAEGTGALGDLRTFDRLGRSLVRLPAGALQAHAELHFQALVVAADALEPLRIGPVAVVRR